MPAEQVIEVSSFEGSAFHFPAPISYEANQSPSPLPQPETFDSLLTFAQNPSSQEQSDPGILKIADILINEESSPLQDFMTKDNVAHEYVDQHAFETQMNEFLTSNASFMIFDINMSKEEIQTLNNIEVTTIKEYDRFGDLNLLKDELPGFLREVTTANEEEIESITNLVANLSESAVQAMKGETGWVALRASVENSLFDVHRWHTDGHFFFPYEGLAFKFTSTLKGDPTLFYPLPEEMRDNFLETQNDRTLWNQQLDDSLALSAQVGQGAIFIVGDPTRSAVHSEPPITQGRLFFSIVVASQSEIAELDQRWNDPETIKQKALALQNL